MTLSAGHNQPLIQGDQTAILQDILAGNPDLAITSLSRLEAADALDIDGYAVSESLPTMSLTQGKIILGPEARLSECPLWKIEEENYERLGIGAWDGFVPCFVTSSAFIAEAYTEAIMAFLDDAFDSLNVNEPIYIIEMATGHGRFSCNMLYQLERKLAYFSRFKNLKIRYVMTDFTDANVSYWRTHESLQRHVESGLLDFAVFRPDVDDSFELEVRRELVSAETVKNPVIAIGNYFFDSIRHDVFRVAGHKLFEGLATVERDLSEVESPDAPIMPSELSLRYNYRELSDDNYYEEPEFNAILKQYRETIRSGTFLFPVGGLKVIRNLQTMSNRNLVLISADKAYAEVANMLQSDYHGFSAHGPIFSFMVNYDAVGRAFINEGGIYLHGNNWSDTLKVVCCAQTEMNLPLERLTYFFREKMNIACPITSITEIVLDAGGEESRYEKICRLLAHLRLSLSDQRIFCDVARELTELFPFMTSEQKHDLIELTQLAENSFYFYRGERNLPFWLAEVYYRLGLQERALFWLERAMNCYSEFKSEYLLMMGRSYEQLNQWQNAVNAYEEALEIDPNCTQAIGALNKLRQLVAR